MARPRIVIAGAGFAGFNAARQLSRQANGAAKVVLINPTDDFDEYLNVPDHPEVFACGDAAAVPDLTRPGHVTPMTAH